MGKISKALADRGEWVLPGASSTMVAADTGEGTAVARNPAEGTEG